jgi:hypothetical protein
VFVNVDPMSLQAACRFLVVVRQCRGATQTAGRGGQSMSIDEQPRPDPDREGISAALARAAEKARHLAERTGTPFIVRRPKPDTFDPERPLTGVADSSAGQGSVMERTP